MLDMLIFLWPIYNSYGKTQTHMRGGYIRVWFLGANNLLRELLVCLCMCKCLGGGGWEHPPTLVDMEAFKHEVTLELKSECSDQLALHYNPLIKK